MTAPIALFRQRNFPVFIAGQFVSLIGERCTYLALVALLAENTRGLRDTHAAWMLSLLANTMLAPVLLFAPFAGAWIDRKNLKHVVVGCDLLRAAIVLMIPVAYRLTGGIASVFVLLFLLFTCGVFFLPAKSSLTPEIVPEGQRLAANTWLTLAGIVATGAGALGGGWLVDRWGWARTLELNGLTYGVSAAALLAIRYTPGPRTHSGTRSGPREYLRQLRDGWTVIRRSTGVALALWGLGLVWWSGGFLHVAGNLHVQQAASAPGVQKLGVLFAAVGVGGAVSGAWVNRRGRRASPARLLGISVLVAGTGLLGFAATHSFAILLAASFTIGLAAAPIILLGETLLQSNTEPGMRARVFATRDFVMRLALLASVSVAAWLTRSCGAQLGLALCGAAVAVAGLFTFLASGRAGGPQGRAGRTPNPSDPATD